MLIAYLMSGVVASLKSSIESSNVWYLSIPAYTLVWLLLSLAASHWRGRGKQKGMGWHCQAKNL
ncbi:MAG: hypothetical protein WCK51_15420, partial [Armatimonadota bacterium]